jgi:hypothetical protein
VTELSKDDQQKIVALIVKAGDVASRAATFAAVGAIATLIIPGVAVGLGSLVGATAGFVLSISIFKFPGSQPKQTFLEQNPIEYELELEIKDSMLIDEISTLEKSIDYLSEIIIVCHQVERPEGKLLDAVEENLARGIRYTFLVSRDSYQLEVNRYYQFFVTIANIVSETTNHPIRASELVRIKPLRINWNDSPYIFYRTKREENIQATIVFRGNSLNQGICKVYNLLDHSIAPAIYNLLLSSIDWQGDVQDQRFSLTSEFIPPEEFARDYLS